MSHDPYFIRPHTQIIKTLLSPREFKSVGENNAYYMQGLGVQTSATIKNKKKVIEQK